MKKILFILSICLFATVCIFAQSAPVISKTPSTAAAVKIEGKIVDDLTNEALIGATITVKGSSISGITDVDGHFLLALTVLDTAKFITVQFIGFEAKTFKIADLLREKTDKTPVKVIALTTKASLLESVVVTGYVVHKSKEVTMAAAEIRSDDIKAMPSAPSKKKPVPPAAKREMAKDAAVTYKGSDVYKTDDKLVYSSKTPVKTGETPMTYDMKIRIDAEDIAEKRDVLKFKDDLIGIVEIASFLKDFEKNVDNKTPSVSTAQKAEDDDFIDVEPSAGQLTASEWRDLDHWDFWRKSLDTVFEPYFTQWKLNFTRRYTVLLRGVNEQPLIDVTVKLIGSDGKTAWSARTDNTGKADLFADAFGKTGAAKIAAFHAGKTYFLDKIKPFEDGLNELKIAENCTYQSAVDIAFVVDATGSMGDEIAYLKSELADVIRRVRRDNPQLSLKLGSVFYRDFGDEYLTRVFPMDNSLKKNVEFIKKQQAGGGGDTPEAVPEGLEAAIDSMVWRENAVARLLFLVLDAPPHLNPENIEKLQRLIAKAAAKGIRIIPVAASGVDKNTEYLMKTLGVATGGTYTFLTDDSGIGEAHLKATTEKQEIERVNDLLVRLIKQYTTAKPCNDDIQQQAQTGGDTDFGVNFKAYPNPVRDILNIDLKTSVAEVFMTNIQGQLIKKFDFYTEGVHSVNVGDLASGVYFIYFKKDNAVCTKKISVVK